MLPRTPPHSAQGDAGIRRKAILHKERPEEDRLSGLMKAFIKSRFHCWRWCARCFFLRPRKSRAEGTSLCDYIHAILQDLLCLLEHTRVFYGCVTDKEADCWPQGLAGGHCNPHWSSWLASSGNLEKEQTQVLLTQTHLARWLHDPRENSSINTSFTSG